MVKDTIRKDRLWEAVLRGTQFLLSSQNEDGGIEFEDENSNRSGIWVTAETLEFFLSSRMLPLPIYEKVMLMIKFLLNTQNEDGSWSMLVSKEDTGNEDVPSIITTGHCLYVLKLATVGEYISNLEEIECAIAKGESWLYSKRIEQNRDVYWAMGATHSSNPNRDFITRMETVFTTFYALMGVIKPEDSKYIEKNAYITSDFIKRIESFFEKQAKWFIYEYNHQIQLGINVTAKVLSTFCRITNALYLLKLQLHSDIFDRVKDDLINIIHSGIGNTYSITSITVGTLEEASSYTKTYNNNTPFDMGMMLIRLEDNIPVISGIINEYLDNQNNDGYWFLNFSDEYKIKTWTTSEALIFLDKAYKKYDLIEDEEKNRKSNELINIYKKEVDLEKEKYTKLEKSVEELEERCKQTNKKLKLTLFLAIIFGGICIIRFGLWICNPSNQNTTLSSLILVFIIPFSLGILCNPIWEWLKSLWNKYINK